MGAYEDGFVREATRYLAWLKDYPSPEETNMFDYPGKDELESSLRRLIESQTPIGTEKEALRLLLEIWEKDEIGYAGDVVEDYPQWLLEFAQLAIDNHEKYLASEPLWSLGNIPGHEREIDSFLTEAMRRHPWTKSDAVDIAIKKHLDMESSLVANAWSTGTVNDHLDILLKLNQCKSPLLEEYLVKAEADLDSEVRKMARRIRRGPRWWDWFLAVCFRRDL